MSVTAAERAALARLVERWRAEASWLRRRGLAEAGTLSACAQVRSCWSCSPAWGGGPP